jgi:hypothetical protein
MYAHFRRQNWTFSYKSNMAPEGAANVNIYAAFLRLAIPIKPTKLEPKRHTAATPLFKIKEFNISQDLPVLPSQY